MRSVATQKNYREILNEILVERCKLNPKYSLRAFSRDLELAPSRVSQILNGKQGLSKERAISIAEKLGFSKLETEYFTNLVEASDSRSKSNRKQALKKLSNLELGKLKFKNLNDTLFKVISDWYFYGVRELTKLPSFQENPNWIANRLSISKYQASDALKKLEEVGLITKSENKGFEPSEDTPTTTHGVPSVAIRNFNKSLLKKAIESIDLQSVDERNFTTFTFALDSNEYAEFVDMIDQFRRQVMKKAELVPNSNKNEVYSLAIQFFRLTDKRSIQ